jgi:2'-5' RNA ligase
MTYASPRYALYFAPHGSSPLWSFGSKLLGYDAVSGEPVEHPGTLGEFLVRWSSLTTEPRKYGFHATLKAPFHLVENQDEGALLQAVDNFSSVTSAFPLTLKVADVGPFIALKPSSSAKEINVLASEIVNHFDHFRKPLSAEDRKRRLQSPLTDRQIAYLDLFGYPYVHEEFRFHMTLTNALHIEDREPVLNCLRSLFETEVGNTAILINRLCVFRQESPQERFRIIHSADFV